MIHTMNCDQLTVCICAAGGVRKKKEVLKKTQLGIKGIASMCVCDVTKFLFLQSNCTVQTGEQTWYRNAHTTERT